MRGGCLADQVAVLLERVLHRVKNAGVADPAKGLFDRFRRQFVLGEMNRVRLVEHDARETAGSPAEDDARRAVLADDRERPA